MSCERIQSSFYSKFHILTRVVTPFYKAALNKLNMLIISLSPPIIIWFTRKESKLLQSYKVDTGHSVHLFIHQAVYSSCASFYSIMSIKWIEIQWIKKDHCVFFYCVQRFQCTHRLLGEHDIPLACVEQVVTGNLTACKHTLSLFLTPADHLLLQNLLYDWTLWIKWLSKIRVACKL